VTHLVLESTGVSWWPIYQWLEGHLHLPVANPAHGKALPGRKTDQTDPEWPADLPRHGLIRGRFVPPRPQRELRGLTRHRLSLRGARSRALNESERTLEGTNLKLSSVGRELQGVSARLILQALVAGPSDPQALAGLAQGRLRQKKVALAAARRGVGREPHRLILGQWLADLALCDEQIEAGSVATAQRVQSHAEWIARLDGVPGIDRKVAEVILAGLGPDPARLGSAERAASWAGLCPGNHQSGGRRHRGRSRATSFASLRFSGVLSAAQLRLSHLHAEEKDSRFRRRKSLQP
jgi:transposase